MRRKASAPSACPATTSASRGATTPASSAPLPLAISSTAPPTRFRKRKLTASEARNASGRTPRASSQSTIGGPLTLIEVPSTPLANPAAKPGARGSAACDRTDSAPAGRCGRSGRPRRRSCQAAARTTATPTITCNACLESCVSATTPTTSPGNAAASIGASARQSTCSFPTPSNSMSTLRATPSTSSVVTASTGSIVANSAGERRRAKPKPVVDWTNAPAKAATAASAVIAEAPGSAGCAPRASIQRHELLREPGQPLVSLVGHRDEVLDADSEFAGHVHARLHRDEVAALERSVGRTCQARFLVDLEPDPVAQAVLEGQAEAGLDHPAREAVHLTADRARPHRLERRLLCSPYDLIGLEGAVVQRAGRQRPVRARGHDCRERNAVRPAILHEARERQRHLALGPAAQAAGAQLVVGGVRDLRRSADRPQLPLV